MKPYKAKGKQMTPNNAASEKMTPGQRLYEAVYPGPCKPFEPVGVRFGDRNLGDMLLVTEGAYKDWLCARGGDGQWVTLRKKTDTDHADLIIAGVL